MGELFKNRQNQLVWALVLFLGTLGGYFAFYTGESKHLNYFVPLANAFLEGKLYLPEGVSWLNELIDISGKFYVVYPPMPAILLMPFVALFGEDFSQPYFAILIAGLNVSLCFFVLEKLFHLRKISVVVSLLYAFGSMQWFHAVAGSAWYIAHIIAMFFIWLMLLELVTYKRYLVVGLLLGAAYWSRLPAVLAIIFPLVLYFEDFISLKPRVRIHFKNIILLGLGVGVFIILNALYNYARFGVFHDISYQLLPIFDEPWYQNGLFSIKNIPVHLNEIFTAFPKITDQAPYVIPSLNVMALWIVMPALLLLMFVPIKKRVVQAALLAVLVMSVPGLTHGSNGFTQFGFRFALDYLPFFMILIAASLRGKFNLFSVILIGLSIAVNLWGMIAVNLLGQWTL